MAGTDHNLGPYRPRPRGVFNGETNYRYLDIVRYNGGSYINCNLDTVDGVACIGILPTGEAQSELYWQPLAEKGDQGPTADYYTPFIQVTQGLWDYSQGDKIFIPSDATADSIDIINPYDGCCGIIITKKELNLPVNSLKSVDYNYVTIKGDEDWYFYTFVYTNIGSDSYMFVWHRSVVNRGNN